MNEEQARQAIKEISDWLASDPPGLPGDPGAWDTPRSELAREFSEALLKASEADGLHGCLLCQS